MTKDKKIIKPELVADSDSRALRQLELLKLRRDAAAISKKDGMLLLPPVAITEATARKIIKALGGNETASDANLNVALLAALQQN